MRYLIAAALVLLALVLLLCPRRQEHRDESAAPFIVRNYPITLNGFAASAAWFRRNFDGFPPILPDLDALRLYAPISLNAFGARGCFVLTNYSSCQLTSRAIDGVASPQVQTIMRNCPQAS